MRPALMVDPTVTYRFSHNGDRRFGSDEFEMEVAIKSARDAGGWNF